MSRKFTQQLIVVISLVTGGLFLYALRGPAVREATLLRPAVGQEIVAARPIDPERRKKDREALEENKQRKLRDQVYEARKRLSQGLVEDAEKILQRVFKDDPTNKEALKLKDKVVAMKAKLARLKAEEEQKAKEKAVSGKLSEAEKLAKKKQYDEAIKLVDEVLKEAPNYTRAKDRLTLWKGKKAAAEREAKLAQVQGQLDQLEAQALKSLKENDFKAARRAADKMLSLDPQSRDAKKLSLKVDSEQKDHEQALARTKIQGALAEAEQLADDGKNQEALKKLKDEVLAADPDNPKALRLAAAIEKGFAKGAARKQFSQTLVAAEAAEKNGKLEDALARFEEAAAIAKETGLKAEYRTVSKRGDDLRAALKDQLAARARAKREAEEAAASQAQALLDDGKWPEATALLKEKLNDPQFQDSKALKALAQNIANSREEAEKAAKRKQAESALADAEDAFKSGDFAKAEVLLKGIPQNDLTSSGARRLKKLEKNIPASRIAMRKAAANAELAKGDALLHEGKFDDAQQQYQSAGKKYPELEKQVASRLSSIDQKRAELAAARATAEQEKAKAEQQRKIADAESQLDSAKALMDAGEAQQAEQALNKIDTSLSRSIAARVARAIEKDLPQAREEAAERKQQAKANHAVAKAKLLVRERKFDDAQKFLDQALADADLEDNRVLRGLAAKVADAKDRAAREAAAAEARAEEQKARAEQEAAATKAKAAQEAAAAEARAEQEAAVAKAKAEQQKARAEQQQKIADAENQLDSAKALMAAGDIQKAEQLLSKIDTSVSRSIASRVTRAIEKDLPRAKAQAVERNRQAKANAAVEKAKLLVDENKFDDARKFLDQALADADLKDNRVLRGLAAKMADAEAEAAREAAEKAQKEEAARLAREQKEREEKDKLAREAKLKNAQDSLDAAMALIAEGKLDAAEKALKAIEPTDTPIDAKVARALERDIPAKRRAIVVNQGRDDLNRAEELAKAGGIEAARDLAEGVKAKYPELKRDADRLLSRMSRLRRSQQREQEREVMARVNDLLKANRVKEAEKLIDRFLAGPLKDNEALTAAKSKIGEKYAEAELAKARDLFDKGDISGAQRVLQEITAPSKKVAAQVDRLLNFEIPRRVREIRIAEGRQQLKRAEGLLSENKFSAARNIARGIKASYPAEVGKSADQFIEKADAAVEKSAGALVDQNDFEGADKMLAEYLEGAGDNQAGNIRKLADSIPELKAKRLADAKSIQLGDKLNNAEKLIAENKLDDAEQALENILSDADIPRESALRALKAQKQIATVRDEARERAARQQLAAIQELVDKEDYQQATKQIDDFEQANRGHGRQIRNLRKALDTASKKKYAAVQKEGLAEVKALVDQQNFDDALKLSEELLAKPEHTANVDLRELNAQIPGLKQRYFARAAQEKATSQLREAEALIGRGEIAQAEAILKQIDTTVSPDIQKKTERHLARIPALLENQVARAAQAKAQQQITEAETMVENDQLEEATALLKQIDRTISRDVEKRAAKLDARIPKLQEGREQRVALRKAEQQLADARALVKENKLTDAGNLLNQIDKAVSDDVAKDADSLAKNIADLQDQKVRLVAVTKAEEQLDEASALIKQNRLDDASRLLGQVDQTASNSIARKTTRLQNDIIVAKDRTVALAARAKLADARKALEAGQVLDARKLAAEAGDIHPSVARDVEKFQQEINSSASDDERKARAAELAQAEELYKAGEHKASIALLEKLEKDGFFIREVRRLKKLAEKADAKLATKPKDVVTPPVGTKTPYADKVADLLKAGDVALSVDNDPDTAKAAYEAVLVWEPQNEIALRRLAEIQKNMTQLQEKKVKIKTETEKQKQAVAYMGSYKQKEELGDLAGAIEDLEAILQINPKDADAKKERNRLLALKKRRKNAMGVAMQAQMDERDRLVTNWLNGARQYLKDGEPDKAQILINRAIALHGRSDDTDFLVAQTARVRSGLAIAPVHPEQPGKTVEPGDVTPGVVTPEVVQPPIAPPKDVDPVEWQKAQELLAKIGEAELIKKQEMDFKVNSLCDEAEKALEIGNFPKAGNLLEEASKWNKKDERVKSLRTKLRILTGTKSVEPSDLLSEKEEERKVRIEMNIAEMEKLFESGNKLLALKQYDDSIERFENARAILRALPDTERLKGYRAESEQKLALARQEKAAEEQRVDELQKRQAAQLIQQQRIAQSNLQKKQREELLSRARAQMEEENYGLAEDYVKRLLNIDPLNAEARGLMSQLQRARRVDRSDTARRKTADSLDELLIQTEEVSTPITTLFEYPDNWQEIIAKRRIGSAISEDVPEWQQEIKAQMEKRISFDFVDTPLADVVAFLTNLTNTNMVLDPAAVEGDDVPVTLKVSDMKLEAALEWILRLVNLTYAFRDEAVFISTPDRVAEKPILRLYDVRDLLAVIPDYSGTGLPSIGEGGGGGGGGGGDLFGGEGGDGERFTGEDLVEFISQTVSPSSWGDGGDDFGGEEEEGGPSGTIAYRSGQLVITQTPDNHRQVEDLLSLFRESARVQVHISARFIEVSEGFIRGIGISWSQLDFNSISSRFDPDPATPDDTDIATTITSSIGAPGGLFGAGLAGLAGSILYRTDVEATLNFQMGKESNEVNTLLAPELTCFNGQQARIAVVTEQRFLEDAEVDTVQGTGGSAGFSTIDPEIGTIDEGINFLVRPTVSSDKRYVTLDLQPQVNDIISMGTLNLTLDVDANTGTPIVAPIQLPSQSVKLIQTSVAVPDGGTLLIGGLIDTEDRFDKATVPFLDRIPVLSALIGQRNKSRSKRYLLILVKASILIRDEMEPPDIN